MVNEKRKLLLPEIVRKEFDNSHYYWVNGEYFPGVTAILDEAAPTPWALKNWMLNNTPESADEIRTTTKDFGSKMHEAYQKLLLGMELDLVNDYPSVKEKKHLMSFQKWFTGFAPDLTSLKPEHTVASVAYKFAGTLDLACYKGGELWIIDFKTTTGIYFSHELQLAAYGQAYREMYGTKLAHIAVLRTGTRHKDGFEFKEITRPFEDFVGVYQTYLSLHDGKIPDPPQIDIYPEKIKLWTTS